MPIQLNHTAEMLDPNTFAVHAKMKTSSWRHRIQIQDKFTDESTHESLDSLCEFAVKAINRVIAAEKAMTDADPVHQQTIIEYLEHDRDYLDGLIGDRGDIEGYEDEFNAALSNLYDTGDLRLEMKDGSLQKFMWIG